MHLPAKRISKSKVLALFYNNKGAEAIIDKDFTIAYAYLREAILTDHFPVDALANLGVLYHRIGENKYAEDTYNLALSINQNSTIVLENLAYVYSITDRQKQADIILARVKEKRKDNPYYHYHLGEIEFENKNWEGAKKHYQKALSINKKQHIFYFALAKVYFLQGKIKLSKKYIALAKKHTPSEVQQLLYQNKLNLLTEQWIQNP
ncbi:MAG: tetratricopeptide repeat protein [Gammaproteobacteria bacterium]|nr:tetratricopeptide repeat protein [Gammaproteobacteria bacterium]